jgi:hypothetical protein
VNLADIQGGQLASLFTEGNAFRVIWRYDGMALTETKDGKPVFTSKVQANAQAQQQAQYSANAQYVQNVDKVRRAFTSCLDARGYSVK